MRIAIMGAGALGGYFGGRLASAGHKVTLIARGAHLEALRSNGLQIQSPKGDLYLPDIDSTDDPSTVGIVDVVMFMVKNYDVEEAAHAIKPMLGAKTMVVTCQNGITAWERLGQIVGVERVIPGVALFPADISAPGVIRHTADNDFLSFGEVDGSASERCQNFRDALVGVGVSAIIPENIIHELWAKFVVQSALSSMTALTRLDIGPLRDNPSSSQLFLDAMAETDLVGRAVVSELPLGIIEKFWQFMGSLPRTMHASMLDDLNNGKPIEVNYLSGEVVRLGELHGVPTPIHSILNAALQPYVDGTPS